MMLNDWAEILKPEFQKPYYKELMNKIEKEYEDYIVYPPKDKIFASFNMSSFKDTKVLILGQDPYHNPFEAMGLCFSVPKGVKVPPSLVNIYKELHHDLGYEIPSHGDLTKWAKQGVLLINALLTVRKNEPLAHKTYGWMTFTDSVIKKLNEKETPVVFVLWGSFARSKKKFITNDRHLVIENVHPSPLSSYRGFFGSKPFSEINNFLRKTNQPEIDFRIEE